MEDTSKNFANWYASLHKTTQQSLQVRKEVTNQLRKEKRCTVAFENRNIDVNMSPVTPVIQRKPIQREPQKNKDDHEHKPLTAKHKQADVTKPPATSKRWEMLVRWREEKLRKKAESANKKPIFKVCHVDKPISCGIETANKFIKGKPIPAASTNRLNIAPNYQFKFKLNTPQIEKKPISKSNAIPAASSSRLNIAPNPQPKLKLNTPQIDNKPITKSTTIEHSTKSSIQLPARREPSTRNQSKIKETTQKSCNYRTNNNKQKVQLKKTTTLNKKTNNILKEDNQHKGQNIKSKNTILHKNDKDNTIANENMELVVKLAECTLKEINIETNTTRNSDIVKKQTHQNVVISDKENIDGLSKTNFIGLEKKLLIKIENCQIQESTVSSSKSTITPRKSSRLRKHNLVLQEHVQDTDISNSGTIEEVQIEAEARVDHFDDDSNTKSKKDVKLTNVSKTPIRRSIRVRNSVVQTRTDDAIEAAVDIVEVSKERISRKSANINESVGKSNRDRDSVIKPKIHENIASGTNKNDSNHTGDGSILKEDSKEEPDDNNDVIYLSPFVTCARGKKAARNEYKARQKLSSSSFVGTPELARISMNMTTPKAGAAYFTCKLDEEIARLERLCDEWETYRNDPDVPNDAHDSIDATVGQTRLLLTKKFNQFRGLIDRCRTQSEDDDDKPVTCEDLHGFWDMMYMQVENLDERFIKLNKLRDNKWEEFLQKAEPVAVKRGRGRPKKATTTKNASSKLKEAIRAARQKKIQDERVFEGGFFSVRSPDVRHTPNKCDHHNTSVRRSRLLETRKSDTLSPSMVMFNMSTAIKSGNGLTPSKSILKSAGKSSVKSKKSVVFREDDTKFSRTKLFFDL